MNGVIIASRAVLFGSALAVAALCNCKAAPLTVTLTKESTRIGLTVYVMGLFAEPGQFHRFAGDLTVDAAKPQTCRVKLIVEVDSLALPDADRTRTALGPLLLDVAHYPGLVFQGACNGGRLAGALTLHGVTRNLSLTTQHDGDALVASGSLARRAFGVNGLPGLVGGMVGLRVTVTLPPGLAARIEPG